MKEGRGNLSRQFFIVNDVGSVLAGVSPGAKTLDSSMFVTPTQNLATTYSWKEVVMAEKVLKKMIPITVMVMLFLRPILSANLPRTKAPNRTKYELV